MDPERPASRVQRRRQILAIATLVGVTAVWGATFVTVKEAITIVPPFEFLAIRFAISAFALGAVWPKQIVKARRAWRASVAIGICLAAGYGFQTFGLKYTTATNAGFITGLFVVFTPIVAALAFRKTVDIVVLGGVAGATLGLGLLVGGPGTSLNRGDLLVVVTAIAFAAHIVVLGQFARRFDASTLAIGQLVVATSIFAVISLTVETPEIPEGRTVWIALIFTAVAATSIAFLVQTWVQSMISPTRTAVILTMEPVFAGIFGALWAGDRLTTSGWIGAGLILASMLLVSARPQTTSEI
jgi:drug/metabolite transporter (DMT)-like permease